MDDITEKNASTEITDETKLAQMTKEEALAYMGLNEDADIKEIDDRFWQMSKKYRGKVDPESKRMEDEIAAVYDIASGRRDIRVAEEQQRETEPKFWGKTKSEWKTYVEYTWYKYLLGVFILIALIAFIVGIVNNSNTSYAVAVFGHLYFDDEYLKEALIEQGAENPYIGYADLVVPNDEGFAYSETGNEMFSAMLYMNPAALIGDKASYPFYFTTFKDLTPLNDQIMAGLTDEAKAGIVPVYMSQREAATYQNEMMKANGFDDDAMVDPSQFSDEPILLGYEITDPELAAKIGVDSMWHSRQTTVIVGQSINAQEDNKTVMVITTIINSAFA